MKHFISTENITKEQLEKLFELANKIKADPKKYAEALKGKIVATLFFEPSTRTRMSFESAILRLGADLISTENARENASSTKGESLEDTIKVVSGYADTIVMRHFEDDSAKRAGAVSFVPVINAGAGGAEHPTQALLDVFTLRTKKKSLDGLSVAIMGDLKYGRTAHSFIKLLSLYKNITVFGYSVKGLELGEEYITFLKKRGVKYIPVSSFDLLPRDVDAIYQTRIQKERFGFEGLDTTLVDFGKFCIDKSALKSLSKDTLIMHPLPRDGEIDPAVDTDPRCVYFEQAQNGVYTRMALLLTMVNN
ncbi:MAG: aspartate carbamoyltransferase [Firmicutes bacterium]|nr:aspartate carbamoyltransferase [Bacillota bacterium]